jgi:GNAT superfamily N-acetyltransferase
MDNTSRDPVIVKQISGPEIESVAPLFDQYRMFYGQPSDPEGARQFMHDRLSCGESVVFAASSGGVTIGFAQLYPVFSSISMKRVWILNDLYVIAPRRGQGAAKLLLQAAKEHARATGAKAVQLSTAADNLPARALYEQAGYEPDTVFLTYELLLEKTKA